MNGLFRNVSHPTFLAFASSVKQRRSGYRELLGYYVQMMQPPTPSWWKIDVQRILELKNAAKIYEYWVFISVCRAVERVLGGPATGARIEMDPLRAWLAAGVRVEWKNGVTVRYTPHLEGYSETFVPDVVLETEAGMWVFDAKFRLETDENAGDGADTDVEMDRLLFSRSPTFTRCVPIEMR